MTSHRNKDSKKELIQTRISECLAQSIREYSKEEIGEENVSWAVRRILEEWAGTEETIQSHD